MRPKRLLVWGVIVSILGGGVLLVVRARSSTLADFYALGPSVGEDYYRNGYSIPSWSAGGYRIDSIHGDTLMPPPQLGRNDAALRQTVLVFPPQEVAEVRRRFRTKFFGGPYRTQELPTGEFLMATNRSVTFFFASGGAAQGIAGNAHMAIDRKGCVVVMSKPPDWFAARIVALLRFLHLA